MNVADQYSKLLDKMLAVFKQVHHLFLLNLNDVFKSHCLNLLINDKLFQDTLTFLSQHNFDLHYILNTLSHNNNEHTVDNNAYIKLSHEYEALINDPLIEQQAQCPNTTQTLSKTRQKNQFTLKKEHEVSTFTSFLSTISISYDAIVEIGCGKAYLTPSLLSANKQCLYIGIDMKEHLITKQPKHIQKNKNAYVLYGNITSLNFDSFYNEHIHPIMQTHNKNEMNMFLIGLHCCGNLTSNSLKIFTSNPRFSHLAIVSCCLNLLKEYIPRPAKESELFQRYYTNIGYDSKGSFLEQTLVFEYDEHEIGYPLSKYMRDNYTHMFLSRNARNAAMQTNNVKESVTSLSYKKLLFRALLQVFFERHVKELSMRYGYAKVDVGNEDTFKSYLIKALNDVEAKCEGIVQEKVCAVKGKVDEVVNEFLDAYMKYDKFLWTVSFIHMRFSKLVEYIIALDRVLFLIENGVKEVRLVRIFNDMLSTRNILIYASK